jgi:hypothetical protein
VDKFGKLGDGGDQVAVHEIGDPGRRFLTQLSLQLYLQDGIRKDFLVLFRHLVEREIDPHVFSPPVLAGPGFAIEIVFSDHGQLGVERDSDPSVSGKLERRSVVERAHDCRREQDE